MKQATQSFLLCAALVSLPALALPALAQEEASCTTAPAQVQTQSQEGATELFREGDLTEEEVERVVDFMVTKILKDGGPSFTREEIHEATGLVVTLEDAPLLQAEVFLKLEDMGIDALAGSRCADYGACSVYGNLSGASGELLAMYEREKKEDGKIFEGFALPEFTASDLSGREVHSSALTGTPSVLVFLSGHCQHSFDSFPILDRLTEDYRDRGLRVVGFYINSGSPEDVDSWIRGLEPKFEVWARNDDELGDLFSGHLVPAYFFLDAQGKITKKLIGFKSEEVVLAEVEQQLSGDSPDAGSTEVGAP